ncbi:MAG: hypothetical protein ACLGHT_03650 [Acidimicrobiia bacterium]
MADPFTEAEEAPVAEASAGVEQPEGAPRWVKISLLIGAALVLLFLLANFTGLAGDHGPGRHGGGGEAPTTVAEDGGGHGPMNHDQ